MKRNKNTRKVANILSTLLILTSPGANAMERDYHKIREEIEQLSNN